ncbi:MAG: hypothetical protein ACXWLJ_03555 [Rhizomicrobium sp.]
MGGTVSGQGEIHQHSGWLIPLGLLGVIVALCGFFLLYYLRPPPAPFRDSRPTGAATPVDLSVRGLSLRIPARYIETRTARGGGDQDVIPLFAALPDMRGYSNAEDGFFSSNALDSLVVHLLIRADTNGLDPQKRFQRIYMPYIVDPKGEPAPFELTHYAFRADSGYGRSDLYVGNGGGLLLLCERPAQDLLSPNCLAIDRPIAPGVNLSYRFKRAQLSRWRAIAEGVDRLVAGFRK